jgi:flagellar basal body-associated protein FliL
MKKDLKIILIIIVLLIIVIAGLIGYFFLQREYRISKLPDSYQSLAKDCKKKGSFGCCMTSVEFMAENNYKLMPETGCFEGF